MLLVTSTKKVTSVNLIYIDITDKFMQLYLKTDLKIEKLNVLNLYDKNIDADWMIYVLIITQENQNEYRVDPNPTIVKTIRFKEP